MATIRKRTTRGRATSWQAQIRRAGLPALTATFATKEEARRWVTAREREMDAGQFHVDGAKKTLDDLLTAYEGSIEFKDLRPGTRSRRVMEIRWWRSKLGPVRLASITPAMVAKCRDALLAGDTPRGRPAAPASVNRFLAGLSSAFQLAVEELGWIEGNPVRRVRKPAEPRGRDRFLSDEEFWRLLEACGSSRSPRLRPLVLAALSSGARRGELLDLPWSAVDLDRGTAALSRTKNNSPRTLFFSGLALEALRDWRARCPEGVLVFEPPRGEEQFPRNHFVNALRLAGIENFHFHDLRHTAATWLGMLGASGPELAAFLGHKTLAMVARYTHLVNAYRSAVAPLIVRRLLGFGNAPEPALEGVGVQVQAPALLDRHRGEAVTAPAVQPRPQGGNGNVELLGDALGAREAREARGARDEVLEILYAAVDFRHPTNKGSDALGGSEEVIISAHTEPSNTGE